MARITFGSIVNSVSGSIDEMVYSTWKGIAYIRKKAITVSNPQSNDQMNIRARMAEVAKYWTMGLTQDERNAWETYAGSIPIPTSGPGDIIKPAKGPFSGFNAFVRNNVNLFISGQKALGQFLNIAPIGVPPPDAPVDAAGGWVLNAVKVSWTPGTIPGIKVCTWLRSIDIPFHAQLNQITAVGSGISSSPDFNGAKGNVISFQKCRGYVDAQLIAYDNQGQPSPVSELVPKILVTGI